MKGLALLLVLALAGCQGKPTQLASARCSPGTVRFDVNGDHHHPSFVCNSFGRWVELSENTGANPFAQDQP